MHVMTASVGAPKLAVYVGAATQRRAAPARMMAAAAASKTGQLRRRQLQATPLRRGVAAARCIAPRRVMTCSSDAEAVKAAVTVRPWSIGHASGGGGGGWQMKDSTAYGRNCVHDWQFGERAPRSVADMPRR